MSVYFVYCLLTGLTNYLHMTSTLSTYLVALVGPRRSSQTPRSPDARSYTGDYDYTCG